MWTYTGTVAYSAPEIFGDSSYEYLISSNYKDIIQNYIIFYYIILK
jgi:hypothetical protein